METVYLIIVIILFLLAISDLIVGVSNDAVNFLNSAVGSKAGSFKLILTIAAAGILIGCTFSSGMMEVARKGIFNPEHFYFSEIIFLFLAVMVADIILLDTFNTFGLPTSTTVSIVFELLGAAVAYSVIKIYYQTTSLGITDYINAESAIGIISGIFLSIFVAFTIGLVMQYLTRMLFSFDYQSKLKYYGSLWGGLAITAITYFIMIKGAQGISFMTDDLKSAISENAVFILSISFVSWVVILQVVSMVYKNFNIMKLTVYIGTFSLAMAFAGNDLVNFIGVPLAGYNSWEIYNSSGLAPDALLMVGLAGKVPTPTILLVLAGVVMAITLWTSKKARSVLKTSLDLGRQYEGVERFASYKISRTIVRVFANSAKAVNKVLPIGIRNNLSQQFDQRPFISKQLHHGSEAPQFDLVRAATTLVVASALIALGTSFKLPLSTTYVTFMVFMGTSLADGAWGRESAVYRVSGVLSVIGGWFFTAFSAFVLAFLIATAFFFGGAVAVALILVLAGYVIYRTNTKHQSSVDDKQDFERIIEEGYLNRTKVLSISSKSLSYYLGSFSVAINGAIDGLETEDLKTLEHVRKTFKPILKKSKRLRGIANSALDKIDEEELDIGHLYILVLEYTQEMAVNTDHFIDPILNYVDNNHKPFLDVQITELKEIAQALNEKLVTTINVYQNDDSEAALQLLSDMDTYAKLLRATRKKQIKRIKTQDIGTRNIILYLSLLVELRNLGFQASRLVKAYLDLSEGQDEHKESTRE